MDGLEARRRLTDAALSLHEKQVCTALRLGGVPPKYTPPNHHPWLEDHDPEASAAWAALEWKKIKRGQ